MLRSTRPGVDPGGEQNEERDDADQPLKPEPTGGHADRHRQPCDRSGRDEAPTDDGASRPPTIIGARASRVDEAAHQRALWPATGTPSPSWMVHRLLVPRRRREGWTALTQPSRRRPNMMRSARLFQSLVGAALLAGMV